MSLDIKMLDLIEDKNPSKVDMVSHELWYIGFKFKKSSLESDTSWKIYRFKMNGNIFSCDVASDDFDKIWNDRFVIFNDEGYKESRSTDASNIPHVNKIGAMKVELSPSQEEILNELLEETKLVKMQLAELTGVDFYPTDIED